MHTDMPRRVKICGIWFAVKYIDGLADGASGLMYGPTRQIHVCTALNDSKELLEATLLHEIVHAILYVSGQTQHLSSILEEGIVCALETGLGSIYGRRR
jgi:hypothetical protein